MLDGITVDLPTRSCRRSSSCRSRRASTRASRYTLDTNRSPGVIAADQIWADTGATGQGMKIGVVDDGIDPTNPFLSPGRLLVPVRLPARAGRSG